MNINMRNFYVLFAVFIFISSHVYAISYDDKTTLTSVVTIENNFRVVSTLDSYSLKYVNVTLDSYPRNDVRQIVNSIDTGPNGIVNEDGKINYFFDNPKNTDFTTILRSQVQTQNYFEQVKIPVKFPLTNIDSKLYPYLEPYEIIDIDSDIRSVAFELIGEKTDLYEIEHAFAEYVRKNIEYDLSSITADATQKSSWVLKNKKGVCDEITSLFISLNRASGIPARFVSGIAYTNLESFDSNWVPHAWAEVYFPGYGWIPFDVTYGQYGFIDAAHIKLQESYDSVDSSVSYNYLGNNVQLRPGSLDIDVQVLEAGEQVAQRYRFMTSLYLEKIGFESYNIVKVDVINDKNYYVVADLYLANTQDVIIHEESLETVLGKTIHRKQVLLKPRETKTVHWLIELDDTLNSGFIYTIPITVYNTYNVSSTAYIESRRDYAKLDKEYIAKIYNSYIDEQKEIDRSYSKHSKLDCTLEKESIYLEDIAKIRCTFDNMGDKTLKNLNMCFETECSKYSLGIVERIFDFEKRFNSTGIKNIQIKAKSDDFGTELFKISYLTLNVLDKPKIVISDVNYPIDVEYGEPFEISFFVEKKSDSSPKNVTIILQSRVNKISWDIDSLDESQIFTIKSNGNTMIPNENVYSINVTYVDDLGNTYSETTNFTIKNNASFFQDILLYLNMLSDIAQ